MIIMLVSHVVSWLCYMHKPFIALGTSFHTLTLCLFGAITGMVMSATWCAFYFATYFWYLICKYNKLIRYICKFIFIIIYINIFYLDDYLHCVSVTVSSVQYILYRLVWHLYITPCKGYCDICTLHFVQVTVTSVHYT